MPPASLASQPGSYAQTARDYFEGVAARADKDGDGMVTTQELTQAVLAS
ncbi:hypothetical protein PUR61_15655 [Streptomyces sp. BE20]|nr:hypothetical protein [Streptomyces sp. BE20]MEE1823617.1 hypothetical protein [Streptomyces sp. BE20]